MQNNFNLSSTDSLENISDTKQQVQHSNIVNVAVAVIHYQAQYLLGFRNSAQHQGNRYEFVGGKIDIHETAQEALVREVAEETGIDIKNNIAVKLGRLHHDYGDKQVCLQVYKVALTTAQYEQYKHCDYGLEGQALTWVIKDKLLAGNYPLPAANQTILSWLQLPTQIVITYPLAHFGTQQDASAAWLNYHQQYINKDSWVYIRTKASSILGSFNKSTDILDITLAQQVLSLRPDIKALVPNTKTLQIIEDSQQLSTQISACHLTHTELMAWFNGCRNENEDNKSDQYINSSFEFSNKPLIISCHDKDSIIAANYLATIHSKQKFAPVIGIFLSPVLFTQTHPDDEPLGWEAWSGLAELADMPVIALGGLSPTMSEHAAFYGASGVAGIREFLENK